MLVMLHCWKGLGQASQICAGNIELQGDSAVRQNYSKTPFSSYPVLL